ncbi:group II intron reverse transcriptase/maturase [Desulfobacteraceae bacterium SEEP-SAG9]|nr:group II intron reverse transcriptase/maturase [Desulfobacteraceae bacterium SEEP-SAG9]
MELILLGENLQRALKRVKQNKGAAGVDHMGTEQLHGHLKQHWASIKQQLLEGTYQPQPVKRVEIPKSDGSRRMLGIPTVLDRFIQQAMLQILQEQWDETFSQFSYGFRPSRSAHQAVRQAQHYVQDGYRWVVDIDLEKFFDRVSHDKLMGIVSKRVNDQRVLKLIRRYLQSGVMINETLHETLTGTPQGGPLSPLLANLLLNQLDRELEKRGHRFVRYADDCNIYKRSWKAGERVKASITRYLSHRLKLKVNEAKSAVARPWYRSFLGFTISSRSNLRVSRKAEKALKTRVREITGRTRGRSIKAIISELGLYLKGWKLYYGIVQVRSMLREFDSWIKRRLRCYQWKQWGRSGYRRLCDLGVSRDLAWNTCKSAHGPWRLSRSPALAFALPARYFANLGLPSLFAKPT